MIPNYVGVSTANHITGTSLFTEYSLLHFVSPTGYSVSMFTVSNFIQTIPSLTYIYQHDLTCCKVLISRVNKLFLYSPPFTWLPACTPHYSHLLVYQYDCISCVPVFWCICVGLFILLPWWLGMITIIMETGIISDFHVRGFLIIKASCGFCLQISLAILSCLKCYCVPMALEYNWLKIILYTYVILYY